VGSVDAGLVRLSVGLEDIDDLTADLSQALEHNGTPNIDLAIGD
jgi:cystathionine beta-lyase/cystathionine gamma-synthase